MHKFKTQKGEENDDLNPNENPEKDIKRTFEPGTYYLEFSKMKEKSGGEYGLYYHTAD